MKQREKLSKQLILFFSLTFLIAWITWFPSFLHPESFRLLSFVGLFAPAISAIIVTFYFEKAKGVKKLLERYKRVRFGILWYVVVILLIPSLFILASLLYGFFYPALKNILLPTSPYFIMGAFVWLMFINSGEEIGWRGFALPLLQKTIKNPLLATLLLGIL